MKLTDLSNVSTVIDTIGYRYRTLLVKFKTGTMYEFKGVPRSVFDAFLKAPSKGHFFAENIRDRYDTTDVSQ